MSPTTAPWATGGGAAAARGLGPGAAGRKPQAAPTSRPGGRGGGGGGGGGGGQLRAGGAPAAALVGDALPAWPAPLLSPRLAGGWELEQAEGKTAAPGGAGGRASSGGGGCGDGGGGGGSGGGADEGSPRSLAYPTASDRDEESRLLRLLRPPAAKRVLCEADLRRWLASRHARAFVGFVLELSAAVAGRSLAAPLRPPARRPPPHAHLAAAAAAEPAAAAAATPPTAAATATGTAMQPPRPSSQGAAAAAAARPAPPTRDEDETPSPAVAALVRALDELERLVDEIPPITREAGALRYGNPAYRDWHAAMSQRAERLLAPALPPAVRRLAPRAAAAALAELAPYWRDSFGNATRIDYGTGHETCFVALLYCLARLGALRGPACPAAAAADPDAAAAAAAAAAADGEAAPSAVSSSSPPPPPPSDAAALVGVVFARYLALMRRVQTTYWLEPAGSHGVWGLDDYQFLPFVWGASQLAAHPLLRPKSIHNDELMAEHSGDYLYLGAVMFVRRVKRGPLHETSPILNDIGGVPTWTKVHQGLVKMYQAEVLGKFPIMQHFLFGGLLPFADEGEESGDGAGGGGGGGGTGEAAAMQG